MTKQEKYKNIFMEVFDVGEERMNESFTFADTDEWTSLSHMFLISELEDTFDVMFDPNDILHFGSYENGQLILKRYGVDLKEEM